LNPALGIIIVLGCITLWFLLARFYKPIGKTVVEIGENAINEMTEEDEVINVYFDTEREENYL
jgi:hypothetical protein